MDNTNTEEKKIDQDKLSLIDQLEQKLKRAQNVETSKSSDTEVLNPASEQSKLLNMENILNKDVFGQSEAIKSVCDAVRRSRAGFSDPNRPVASFLLLGPSGVGKTELAKSLAALLFDSESAIIRIDMAEFSVARLIGSPSGYVGYEEGGYLTECIRRRPFSVILLESIEKAHTDVLNIVLQILTNGQLTDGQGRLVDFRNAVILMTSSLGSHAIKEQAIAGKKLNLREEDLYDAIKEVGMNHLHSHFRPEFINQIDEVVAFSPLDAEHIRNITRLEVKFLVDRMKKNDINLIITDGALDKLGEIGHDSILGAHKLKRAIQTHLENPLAKSFLSGRLVAKQVVTVSSDLTISVN